MRSIRTAVIGVGHLGRYHARTLKQLQGNSLEYICDINQQLLAQRAVELGVKTITDYRDLLGKVDAVCVVVPTDMHYEVASFFLKHNIHVLCEKPFTKSLDEAKILIELSQQNNTLLQIGHIERFNSAFLSLKNEINSPSFIECQRLGPYTPRVKDVGVVLDLMIHDIDLVLSLKSVPVERIHATGVSVFSKNEDMANAHILFKDGTMANINASRLTSESIRKFRVFKDKSYYSIDFGKLSYKKMSVKNGKIAEEKTVIKDDKDSLTKELQNFLESIFEKKEPIVTGVQGMDALNIALTILERIKKGNK